MDRLNDDHRHARIIRERLNDSGLFAFDPPMPQTNILRFRMVRTTGCATAFVEAGLLAGVRVRAIDQDWLRVTTHLDVSEDDACSAARALIDIAGRPGG